MCPAPSVNLLYYNLLTLKGETLSVLMRFLLYRAHANYLYATSVETYM